MNLKLKCPMCGQGMLLAGNVYCQACIHGFKTPINPTFITISPLSKKVFFTGMIFLGVSLLQTFATIVEMSEASERVEFDNMLIFHIIFQLTGYWSFASLVRREKPEPVPMFSLLFWGCIFAMLLASFIILKSSLQ